MAMSRANDFDAKQDAALQSIYWRDEILQLMYWLKGEGILADVASDDLQRFLEADPGRVGERLAQLVQDGYLTVAPPYPPARG